MGGNALAKIEITVRRIESRERFVEVRERVTRLIGAFYSVVRPCHELAWKETFGDIDVLVADPVRAPFDPTSFGSLGVVRNANVCSFEFEGHQIDVIEVPAAAVEMALFVVFGELGMCLGPSLKRMGLKIGLTGLYQRYEVRTLWYDLLLTRDLGEFLRFVGLEGRPLPYSAGSYREIFDYIKGGNFWYDDTVGTETLDTERNKRRRPMYLEFREYCSDPANAPAQRGDDPWPYDIERNVAFFGKTTEFREAMDALNRRDAFRQHFNGHIVGDVTGLCGRELGAFMRYFLGDDKDGEVREALMAMTDAEVRERLAKAFGEWRKA